MNTLFIVLMVAIILACLLLIVIILAQNPKGGGLSGTFGGTSSASFGIQRTNDFMDKATWTLGVIITVMIFLSVVITAKPSAVAPVNTPKPQKDAPMENATKSQTQPETKK